MTDGLGRRAWGLGAILLGAVELAFGSFAEVWLPVPAGLPGYAVLAYAVAGALILGGVAVNLPKTAPAAALALTALFVLGMLILEAPPALAKPGVWAVWQSIAESAVMAAGGVLAWTQLAASGLRTAAIERATRLVFGLCLLVFGVSHFVYARFTAAMVPAWIPPSQLVWAYLTGGAQIAAGLAVLSGVWARPAAILLTVMYAAFGLLVHIPSVVASPLSHDNWAENGINLILLGAAWTLADSLRKAARE